MKKIFVLVFVFLLLCGCANTSDSVTTKETKEIQNSDYVKSVWISYYELESFLKDSDEKKFKKRIEAAFKELFDMGFNTVTVHVRPCADAFYRSDIFPSSKYCFGVQGADMPFDPLEIMCDLAKKNNLKIEAWINPYRVSLNNKTDELCDSNIAKMWLKNNKKKSNVFVTKNGIYFNPSSKDVQKLIVRGVKEIVESYDISAVHFDDYFYPTTAKRIDSREYKKYKSDGGDLSLSDWRRENVSKMIKSVYKAVKKTDNTVRFGISPAADIKNDYITLYADVERWMSESGYVDYICPQVYFGFKNVYQPFMFTVKKWMYLAKCDLYIGLPLYKAGKPDKYAASENKNIINEFVNNNNIIARQITYLSKLDRIKGFYVFSYSSLKDEKCKAECENMIKAMQSSSQPQQNKR